MIDSNHIIYTEEVNRIDLVETRQRLLSVFSRHVIDLRHGMSSIRVEKKSISTIRFVFIEMSNIIWFVYSNAIMDQLCLDFCDDVRVHIDFLCHLIYWWLPAYGLITWNIWSSSREPHARYLGLRRRKYGPVEKQLFVTSRKADLSTIDSLTEEIDQVTDRNGSRQIEIGGTRSLFSFPESGPLIIISRPVMSQRIDQQISISEIL